MNASKKYLVFTIDKESYAIPIAKVQEVIRYLPITQLHEASKFLKGVVNLRGRIIPIIDMRLKFGLEEKLYSDRTIFVIVEILGAKDINSLGLAVDAVNDVVDLEDGAINKTPEIGFKFRNKYLYGIAQVDARMIMILNLDAILSSEEVIEIGESLEKPE